MRKTTLSLLLAISMLFTFCSDESTSDIYTSETQQQEILEFLNNNSNQTEISEEEKSFFEELHTIANNIDAYYQDVSTTNSLYDKYLIIKSNFKDRMDLVTDMAAVHYNNNRSSILLAQNAFVLMSYDALERHSPEFLWTKLGVFAANEVRAGLVMSNQVKQALEQNNIHIVMDVSTGDEATDVLEQANEILMSGQRNVLKDIGALSILNKFGADLITNEPWLTQEAKDAFRLQHLAEIAKANNNTNEYFDLQTEAAVQFGAHEQIYILQAVWDEPLMHKMRNLNIWLMNLSNDEFVFFGDIFIGTNKYLEKNEGYTIHLPSHAHNLVIANHRVEIAKNGFNTLNELRKNEDWSYWINYSQLRLGKYINTYQY